MKMIKRLENNNFVTQNATKIHIELLKLYMPTTIYSVRIIIDNSYIFKNENNRNI